MTTIGILGAGQAGSALARAAIAAGYDIVIANSRGPKTLRFEVALVDGGSAPFVTIRLIAGQESAPAA